jgi:hypothetical protein
MTRRLRVGTDLWEDTDLRRFDQISLGSSFGARVECAVDGREPEDVGIAAIILDSTGNVSRRR